MKTLSTLFIVLWPSFSVFAQCAAAQNVFAFTYDGKTYEIIKENKTWANAAACAVSRGGYLAEINSLDENQAIFNQLANAGVDPDDTKAPDGFSSYVWLGGNDINTEGSWLWNGSNSITGTQFWQGTANGNPVNGLFSFWGNEPDNWGSGPGQDGLGMAVINWPLGTAGHWNDINHNNTLFFVVEYSSLTGVKESDLQNSVSIFPNPATDVITIAAGNTIPQTISIINTAGQEVKFVSTDELKSVEISLSDLPAGVYFINIFFKNSTWANLKLLKK